MNKKLVIGCIGIVFMLMAISFATAINNKNVEKKESPLFNIRANSGNCIQKIRENIKARFIGNKLFFLPFALDNTNQILGHKLESKAWTLAPGCTVRTGLAICTHAPCFIIINHNSEESLRTVSEYTQCYFTCPIGACNK